MRQRKGEREWVEWKILNQRKILNPLEGKKGEVLFLFNQSEIDDFLRR